MAAVNQPTAGGPPPAPDYLDPVDAELVEPAAPTGGEPEDKSSTLPPIVDPDGELEALEDRSMPVDRRLWAYKPHTNPPEVIEQVYTQKGLSWFGKLELYGLLGQAVKVVLEGDNPMGVGSLLDMVQKPRDMIDDLLGGMPGADTIPGREMTEEMDLEAGKILAAFAQVVQIAPDLVKQAYCIALAIPKTHRQWAIEWAFPNMDDEMGQDILHTFIDQNWGVMEDFFTRELPKIIKRVVKARKVSAGPR